jgi:PAS domain S-box-containing protein
MVELDGHMQAEEEFRKLREVLPQYMCVYAADASPLYANDGLLDYLGFTMDEFRADDFQMRVFHPEDLERVQSARKEAMSRGEGWEIEARIRRKDSQYRWFLIRGKPLRDEAGNIVRWFSSGTDIEDRKQAERELQQIVDAVPQMIGVTEADGHRVYANQVLLDFLGWNREDLQDDEKLKQAFHPDDLFQFWEMRQKGLSRGLPFQVEVRLRRRDGQYRWCLLIYNPLRDEQGRVVRWYSTGTDIDERKHAEEALRRSEAYLAEAQRLSHTGSWAHDPIRREIIYWSEEVHRIFGFDPQGGPVTYRQAHSLIHPDDVARFDETLGRAIREKSGAKIDFRLRFPDGTIKHVHCVSHTVLSAAGEVVELVGTNMDVTEQYEAKAALEKSFEEIKKLKDELYRENLALKEEIDQTSMFEEIVGTSPLLKRVLAQVAKVGPTDSTVLISGETGTGKELIARAIHKRSTRAAKPFMAVNCAALPPALVGSELFGHEKGAFTGATQRRLGRFELADRGTLFLDEVGDLPEETQIALLRVLQERQLERIGGGQPISVDVRIIAATNRDLRAAVGTGSFREDLFYRLNVFPLAIPPLRDRKDDIPLLVEYLVERYASKAGKKIKRIQKRTLDLFWAYDWPGNIRELQNVIERAVILCDGETFSIDEVWLKSEMPRADNHGNALARPTADQERKLIESALTETRGRIAGPKGAAAKLGIPRSTLETKIRKLGIKKHSFNPA